MVLVETEAYKLAGRRRETRSRTFGFALEHIQLLYFGKPLGDQFALSDILRAEAHRTAVSFSNFLRSNKREEEKKGKKKEKTGENGKKENKRTKGEISSAFRIFSTLLCPQAP